MQGGFVQESGSQMQVSSLKTLSWGHGSIGGAATPETRERRLINSFSIQSTRFTRGIEFNILFIMSKLNANFLFGAKIK